VGARSVDGINEIGKLGFTDVLDFGNVSVCVRLVGDDLNAAIGKKDTVRSSGNLSIAALRVRIVVVGFGIFYFPFEAERLCGL
jgi:hypothetical protein